MGGIRAAAASTAVGAMGVAGLPAFGGELAGGHAGKKLGKAVGGDRGAKLGKRAGALGGATCAGALAGAAVGGPVGAAAGAGAGAAYYGIGRVVNKVVNAAVDFEGIAVNASMRPGRRPLLVRLLRRPACSREEAAFCIITEEGIGRCYFFFYRTEEEAMKCFSKWWCPRMLFALDSGSTTSELDRRGCSWSHNTIRKAAARFFSPEDAAELGTPSDDTPEDSDVESEVAAADIEAIEGSLDDDPDEFDEPAVEFSTSDRDA